MLFLSLIRMMHKINHSSKFCIVIVCLSLLMSCNTESLPICEVNTVAIAYPFIAHSHNDYDQDRPILLALEHGFTSFEVDIAYDGTDIRVSHDDKNLSDKPLFYNDYFMPLLDVMAQRAEGVILLIDIKNYSQELLISLNSIIAGSAISLISRDNPNDESNSIKLILSGDIPRHEIVNEPAYEFLFIDGRLNDLDLSASSDIVPLISINKSDLSGSIINDSHFLRFAIEQVHESGKMIRLWNTKDRETEWLDLIDAGVDIIGVDDIEHFCATMQKNGLIN